jgi:hypothetical protein
LHRSQLEFIIDGVGFEGDELIVGCASGDVIVHHIDPNGTLVEKWRTYVGGAAGCNNGLHVANLDGDLTNELYVASSSGLWRFVQPGELGPGGQ